jgi:glutamate/tyrosine decarboxylase-like PLP-dependent enzyme
MNDARSTLGFALEQALSYLDGLDRSSVAPTADLATLRRQLNKPLADVGLPPEQVVRELARDVAGGIMGSAGGRFFSWVIGGTLPSALAADWLTSTWDQNAGLHATAPAAAVVEEAAGSWLKQLFQLPESASFAFVTGCQMAHATCLAAARHHILKKRGWNVEERGLSGSPLIRILSSDQRHGSVDRAIRLLGLGTANIECLATDSFGRIQHEALIRAFQSKTSSPTILLLQAGEINTGSFDTFASLIPVAHQHDAWVHVDGAFGLWAASSPDFSHLTQGMAAADSWATDGHKWLNVPYDSGFAFVAHPQSHRASMSYDAPYLVMDTVARDQMDWNPEFSRRARGFAAYAALRELGRNGVVALVDRCCLHAKSIVAGIGQIPGAEVLSQPVINQGLVRFLDPQGIDHDRHTNQVIAAINKTGEAFFGGTTWNGMRAMRVSVSNWRTTADDVQRTVRAVEQAMQAVSEAPLKA